MHRKDFIKTLATFPFLANAMNLNALHKLSHALMSSERMPVLFLGHGSPMNAIEDNDFVRAFTRLGQSLQKPKLILCISAHWETNGTFVTAMEKPRTIHDFGGFPEALYSIQYPAPGSRSMANDIKSMINITDIELDHSWGLDHGAWTVLRHLYPEADIPVIQMSLDRRKSAQYHFELAKELSNLRNKGVLIVGSGNMVHNLKLIAWDRLQGKPFAFDWAQEANESMKTYLLNGEFQRLVNYHKEGKAFQLAVPSPEHYLPLIYACALRDKKDEIQLFNDQPVGGSISMTSVKFH